MPRYNLFTGIARTLRILELCLALFLLSWIVTRLPFAVRVSGEYLRKLFGFVGSPLFVFAISNAIVAALVAQSGRFTRGNDSSIDHCGFPSEAAAAPSAVVVVEDVGEYKDKCTDKDSEAKPDSDLPKVYGRSQSEKWTGEGEGRNKTVGRKLRRSETEKVENLYPQDKLSNEEFRRTIEAFIAKQMRFLREESLDIFVQTSEPTGQAQVA